MPKHTTVNRPVRTSTAVLPKPTVDVSLAEIVDSKVPAARVSPESAGDALVDADALVEEVSIDGMCGVY